MAGLAAARALVSEGFQVVVLESRDRIGGRIFTDRSLGAAVDLGASWIHGMRRNPIRRLAREVGAECFVTDYDDLTIYLREGRKLGEQRWERLEGDWEEMLYEVESLADDSPSDLSFRSAVHRVLTDTRLDPLERRFLQWRLETLAVTSAASLDELSLLGDTGDSFGGDDCLFPEGYDRLVNSLARGLDIRLGRAVSEIRLLDGGVKLRTRGAPPRSACSSCHEDPRRRRLADASSQEELSAEHAVISLPLGVLKASLEGGGPRFDPELPASKAAAIERLAIGDLDKVALLFPRVFWPERHFLGDLDVQEGGFPVFQNYALHSGRPILVGFAAGPSQRSHGLLSDGERREQAMSALRSMLGTSLPQPRGVAVSRWHLDPFAIGAYSYIAVGNSDRDFDQLARPVGGRLHFAGEATIRDHSGTVHGAYLSGLRAAAEISG